jgi:hypothetical protein
VRAEILRRNLPFSISDIEEACPGFSHDMVRLVLRAMNAEALIAPTGRDGGPSGSGSANDRHYKNRKTLGYANAYIELDWQGSRR